MDIYRDYFTREELVRVLSQRPYIPGRLGELGLFETVPLTSTTFSIEIETKDQGKVLTAIPRGAPRTKTGLEKGSVVSFQTTTYGDDGTVYADEVLNARGAGPAAVRAVIENRRAKLVAKLRRHVDLTHEFLRMSVLLNPGTTEFGSADAGQAIALGTDTTKTRQEIFNKIIKPIESNLDGLAYTGTHVLCEDGFWAQLIENKAVKDTYLNWQAAAELRRDPREMFSFGNVVWERYRGGAGINITANEAVAFPLGVPETFFQAFAPNDTVESVGSAALGQPYYMGSKPITDALGTKGWEVAIATHPRMVCGRPKVVRRITLS